MYLPESKTDSVARLVVVELLACDDDFENSIALSLLLLLRATLARNNVCVFAWPFVSTMVA